MRPLENYVNADVDVDYIGDRSFSYVNPAYTLVWSAPPFNQGDAFRTTGMFLPSVRALSVKDDPTNILSGAQILVALIDLVERISRGNRLVQL
jgi:hypothetical protein